MFWKIEYFIREFYKQKGPFDRILDVGSRNINGSVKDGLGPYKEFTGIDFLPGKDVDIVMNGHDIAKEFDGEIFDLVTCCETMEHDVRFWETVYGMRKVLKPGGYLLVTSPGINFFHHDFPSDYYRFTEEAFKDFIFEGYEDVHVETYRDPADETGKPNNTVLGYGRKPQ